MATTEPPLAVFRHASDIQAVDCGRACAQSVISSLTQGVPIGRAPTPAEKARPVPVTQDALRQREGSPVDVPGHWYTHPDELVQILVADPGLIALGHVHWKVGAYDTQAELLENVGLSLKRGFPAIMNITENDHWVTVRAVDHTSGVVSFVYMIDPLNPRNSPGPLGHTYYDGCTGDGTTIWETIELPAGDLGSWDLPVGSTPPANYAGKYVAVLYEPPAEGNRQRVVNLAGLRNRVRKLHKRPKGATPLLRIREELQRVANATKVAELVALAAAAGPLTVRYVQDIEARLRGYTAASLFSERLQRGLVGIFDFNDQQFRHLRLTADRRLTDSLAGDSSEPLWWTKQRLEPFCSPCFPFRRERAADGRVTYRRLIDDVLVTPAITAAELKGR